jgi:hypothetical protein
MIDFRGTAHWGDDRLRRILLLAAPAGACWLTKREQLSAILGKDAF